MFLIVLLFIKIQNYASGHQHIEQCKWYHDPPSQVHQLIVPESWNRPAHPHEKENEKYCFCHQRQYTQYGSYIWRQS